MKGRKTERWVLTGLFLIGLSGLAVYPVAADAAQAEEWEALPNESIHLGTSDFDSYKSKNKAETKAIYTEKQVAEASAATGEPKEHINKLSQVGEKMEKLPSAIAVISSATGQATEEKAKVAFAEKPAEELINHLGH